MSLNYNTTYNIKQPNFWQTFAQGALQSLGLGGCCNSFGGGFGIGGFNSIFNCGSMGTFGGFGCGGYTDYDTSAGYAVANAVGGVLMQAISTETNKRSAKLSAEEQIEKLNSEIKTLETKAESPEKEIGTKYDADIKSATTNRDKWESSKNTLQDRLNTLQAKSADELTDTEKKELATLQGTGSGSVAYAKEQYEKYQKELQEANEAKDKAIADKKAELEEQIKEKQAEKDKLEKEVNDKLLDKADGSYYKQLKKEQYDLLFEQDGTTVGKDAKVGKNAIRAAIQGYRNAKTNQDKEKYKTQLKNLWAKLDPKDQDDKTLSSAYDLICG